MNLMMAFLILIILQTEDGLKTSVRIEEHQFKEILNTFKR